MTEVMIETKGEQTDKALSDLPAGTYFEDESDQLCLKLDDGYVWLDSPSGNVYQHGDVTRIAKKVTITVEWQ